MRTPCSAAFLDSSSYGLLPKTKNHPDGWFSFLTNDCNFDTKIIVRGNLGMNCQALYNGNYNNLLKFELHILMLGFQVSDHLFCYRLKSTTENNVLARARANDKRKTNPYLQVCISADKCARRFPH